MFSRGLLKLVCIGCLRITAGDWSMESSENSPSSSMGLVVCFSWFWFGSDGKSLIASSIVGLGTCGVGVDSLVIGVSVVDLCPVVVGGICEIGVSSIAVEDLGICD